MPFCINCGAKLSEGARFCSSCGVSQQAGLVAVAQPKGHRSLAIALVLIGGVLGLVFALFSLAIISFFAGTMDFAGGMMRRYGAIGMMGIPQFGMLFGVSLGLVMLWFGVGFVGALLAIFSGLKLHQNYSKNWATMGIIGGVLLLITFSWIPGLIVLAGGILAYTE